MQALCEKVALALGVCGVLPHATAAPSRPSDVIVSCSGGVDSCALLRAVAALRSSAAPVGGAAAGLNVHVLHFNHRVRPESRSEEQFVAALAKEVGADSFHVRTADFDWEDARGFTQARARAWRRRESLSLSRQYGNCFVLLGHHRDDNVETVLLKLIRGCHVSKLTGMESVQGHFVRPMLGIGKEEIVRSMMKDGHKWCEDASNSSTKYTRNKVRRTTTYAPCILCKRRGGSVCVWGGARSETRHRASLADRRGFDESHNMNQTAILPPTPMLPPVAPRQVRLELVPLLQELSSGSLETRIDDMMRQSSLVQEMLASFRSPSRDARAPDVSPDGSRPAQSLDLRWWREQPELVREDQIHRLAWCSTGRAVSYEKIKIASRELLCCSGGGSDATGSMKSWKWQLTKTCWMVRRGDLLVIEDDADGVS